MATKKKKSMKAKRTAGRKARPTEKQAQKSRSRKKSAKRAAAPNKPVRKGKGLKKTMSRDKGEGRTALRFPRETSISRSGEQSGDLQGLSDVETADSESVDELLEEGNAFEAGVVSGVERAGQRGEKEVRTHEVPEDDVPEEYLDKD
jgi:hypothetical protein